MKHRVVGLLSAVVILGASGTACVSRPDPAGPREVLRSVIFELGWSSAELPGDAVLAFASGTLDKAAEGQGLTPFAPAPGRYTEMIAVSPVGPAVAWNYLEERYDGTHERYGETYPSDELRYHLVYGLDFAVPVTATSFAEERRRLRRRFLPLLVGELLEDSLGLTSVVTGDGTIEVSGLLQDGTRVSLGVTPGTSLPAYASYSSTMPGKGPVAVRWIYGDYREVSEGVLLPFSYASSVGRQAYTDMTVDSVRFGGSDVFEPPAAMPRLESRALTDPHEADSVGIHAIGEGIFVARDVRSGFAPLVVELETSILVVDAPASFPLLGQIPADETDPGPNISWATERFTDAVARRWPAKPILYAVLTHHHEDHVGGVRALVAAGATILGSEETLEVVRRLVELPPDVISDRLAEVGAPLVTDVIRERRVISDASQAVEIIPVGENPHAAGMLVVSLPRANALYVSDLVTPTDPGDYPEASHAALDRFFASWLVGSGLSPGAIWSMHRDQPATASHLGRIAEDGTADSSRVSAGSLEVG